MPNIAVLVALSPFQLLYSKLSVACGTRSSSATGRQVPPCCDHRRDSASRASCWRVDPISLAFSSRSFCGVQRLRSGTESNKNNPEMCSCAAASKDTGKEASYQPTTRSHRLCYFSTKAHQPFLCSCCCKLAS